MSEISTEHPGNESGGFARNRVESMLDGSGITINGPNPWDIQVSNPGFYKRVLSHGSLGLGETYMDEWWECEQIDEFVNRLMRARARRRNIFLSHFLSWAGASLFNLQKQSRVLRSSGLFQWSLYSYTMDLKNRFTCYKIHRFWFSS